MNEPTEHEGLAHPDEWRLGATCKACQDRYIAARISTAGVVPMTNLAWLKNSNANDQTAMQMVREIEDGARESGKDIRHVGGSSKAKSERNERIFGATSGDA